MTNFYREYAIWQHAGETGVHISIKMEAYGDCKQQLQVTIASRAKHETLDYLLDNWQGQRVYDHYFHL